MDKSKTAKIILSLFFFYLVLFPFGQMFKLFANFQGMPFFLHPTDILIFLIFVLSLPHLLLKEKSELKRQFFFLTIVLAVTLVFSRLAFGIFFSGVSGFYLLRFVAYAAVIFSVERIVKNSKKKKELFLSSLISAGVLTSLFGFFQYFFLPDLRALYFLGWDDHLFRLTSTFLDPAFTGIILVLTVIVIVARIALQKKKGANMLFLTLTILALFLTYSRASYISLLVGIFFLLWNKKSKKYLLSLAVFFVISLSLLPNKGGEGANLLRTKSFLLKSENYQEGALFFSRSPLFGFGFNNTCIIRQITLREKNPTSHSCSGFDSSVLFILATSGVIGLIAFSNFTKAVFNGTTSDVNGKMLKASFAAVLVHSLFTNTLFYPWVMGWIFILSGLSRKESQGE